MELEFYVSPGPDRRLLTSGPGHMHTSSSYDVVVLSDSFRELSSGSAATMTVSYLGHSVAAGLTRSSVYGNRMTGHVDMPAATAADIAAVGVGGSADSNATVRLADGSIAASGPVVVVVSMPVSDPTYEVNPPSPSAPSSPTDTSVDTGLSAGSTRPVAGGVLYARFAAIEAAIAGLTGYTKESIGLGNVDNTSDLSKPVSTAVSAVISEMETRISAIAAAVSALTGEPADPDGGSTGGGSTDGGSTGDESSPSWVYDEIDKIETDLDALAQRVTAVEGSISGAVSQASWAADRSAALETSLQDLMSKWRDAKSEMISLEGTVGSYSSVVTSMSGVLSAHTSRLASVESAIETMSASTSSTSDFKDTTASRLTALETRADGCDSSLTDLSGEVDDLSDDVASLTSSVAEAVEKMSTVDTVISTANGIVSAATTTITALSASASSSASSAEESAQSAEESAESARSYSESVVSTVSGMLSSPDLGSIRTVTSFRSTPATIAKSGVSSVGNNIYRLENNSLNVVTGVNDMYLLPGASGSTVDLYIAVKVLNASSGSNYAGFLLYPEYYDVKTSGGVASGMSIRVERGLGIVSTGSVMVSNSSNSLSNIPRITVPTLASSSGSSLVILRVTVICGGEDVWSSTPVAVVSLCSSTSIAANSAITTSAMGTITV